MATKKELSERILLQSLLFPQLKSQNGINKLKSEKNFLLQMDEFL